MLAEIFIVHAETLARASSGNDTGEQITVRSF